LSSSSVGCAVDGNELLDQNGTEITDQNDSTILTG